MAKLLAGFDDLKTFAVPVAPEQIAQQFGVAPDALELPAQRFGTAAGVIRLALGVVGAEVDGPVGEEFRSVSDKMKIGRTMDVALQETADRLGTPEFQFFVITIAIQRETGGNLAATLENLSNVLRSRKKLRDKISAMSSEAKASGMIIGSLPFLVAGIIWILNPSYISLLFTTTTGHKLMMGSAVWMALGVLVMYRMINFRF